MQKRQTGLHFLVSIIVTLGAFSGSVGCAKQPRVTREFDSAYLMRTSLRAPRPSMHPERKAYRPRLQLRDSPGVRRALQTFTVTSRSYLEDSLQRYPQYQRDFIRVFTFYGMPIELSNLAIVESRLVADARSPRGAVGLWQFMPRTARNFGLKVNLLRDDRKDPRRSTVAAALYLQQLHQRFDDWFLAIAAYNCGPARLARIIEREGTKDFFTLAERGAVSRETKELVERFIAVSMVMRNRDVYDF